MLLFQIATERFPRRQPIAPDLEAVDLAFADQFADMIGRKATEVRSLRH